MSDRTSHQSPNGALPTLPTLPTLPKRSTRVGLDLPQYACMVLQTLEAGGNRFTGGKASKACLLLFGGRALDETHYYPILGHMGARLVPVRDGADPICERWHAHGYRGGNSMASQSRAVRHRF